MQLGTLTDAENSQDLSLPVSLVKYSAVPQAIIWVMFFKQFWMERPRTTQRILNKPFDF